MAKTTDTKDREPASFEAAPSDRSIRPVIEHALTVYYDGNAELASRLIEMLLSEDRSR